MTIITTAKGTIRIRWPAAMPLGVRLALGRLLMVRLRLEASAEEIEEVLDQLRVGRAK